MSPIDETINPGRSAVKRRVSVARSTNDQPAMKSVKTETEPASSPLPPAPVLPSQEVVELQQQVAKLEKGYEGACRYARQCELKKEEKQKRLEALENLLDTKPAAIRRQKEDEQNKLEKELEKTQKRVGALTKQLERSRDRTRLDEVTTERDGLVCKLADADRREKKLMKEQQEKLTEVSKHLEKARRDAANGEKHLQERIEQVTANQDELALQLAASAKREKDQQKKIAELTRKLALSEARQQQQPINARSMLAVRMTTVDAATGGSALASRGRIDHPANILELWQENSTTAISYPEAASKLLNSQIWARDSHGETEEEWQKRRKDAFKGRKLHCTTCNKTCENEKILDHFFSPNHGKKVLALGGAVSLAAFKHWHRKLESITKKPTAAAATVAAITVAPPAASRGAALQLDLTPLYNLFNRP